MSSILRALKKLENNPRHMDDSQTLANKFVPLADTAQRKSFSHLIMLTVGGGVICGIVFFAAWWLFSGEKRPAPASSPPATQQQVAAKPEESTPAAKTTPTVPAVKKQEPTPAGPVPVRAAVAPVSEPAPQSVVVPRPDNNSPETISHAQESAELAAAPKREELHKDTPSVAEHSLVAKSQISPAPAVSPDTIIQPKKPEIPQLTDPDIKLQALTWSKEPNKRIAVINNRIVREGDMVSGYLVSTINQDDVFLRQQGKTWKLFFSTK